jgi:hypothetical protein
MLQAFTVSRGLLKSKDLHTQAAEFGRLNSAIKSDVIHELRQEHQCMHVHKECNCSNNGLKFP